MASKWGCVLLPLYSSPQQPLRSLLHHQVVHAVVPSTHEAAEAGSAYGGQQQLHGLTALSCGTEHTST